MQQLSSASKGAKNEDFFVVFENYEITSSSHSKKTTIFFLHSSSKKENEMKNTLNVITFNVINRSL